MTQHHVPHIGRKYLTPAIIIATGSFVNPGASFTVTPASTALPGSLLLVHVSQQTSLTPGNFTLPTGWAVLVGTGTTSPGNCVFYKFAGPSEPSSYTFTYSASITMGWEYLEISNCAKFEIRALNTDVDAVPGTYTAPTQNARCPGFFVSFLSKSTTTAWSPSAGWTLLSAAGQGKAAYLQVTNQAVAQGLTWSRDGGLTTSTDITHTLLFCIAKSVQR